MFSIGKIVFLYLTNQITASEKPDSNTVEVTYRNTYCSLSVDDNDDNCPFVFNPSQWNNDNDTIGDACDNCVFITNPLQEDSDNDGAGRECDANDNDGSVGEYVLLVDTSNGSIVAKSSEYTPS